MFTYLNWQLSKLDPSTTVGEYRFVFLLYIGTNGRQCLFRLSGAKQNAWRKTGCPPHLGLLGRLLSQYEVNLHLVISKTASIQTRPFDSAYAPLKEIHFVSLLLKAVITKKVSRQKLSRPKESVAF